MGTGSFAGWIPQVSDFIFSSSLISWLQSPGLRWVGHVALTVGWASTLFPLKALALCMTGNVQLGSPQLSPRTTDSPVLPFNTTYLVTSSLVWQGVGAGLVP